MSEDDESRLKYLERELDILLTNETPSAWWKGHRKGYYKGFVHGAVFVSVVLFLFFVYEVVLPFIK